MYKEFQPLDKSSRIIKKNITSILSRFFREETCDHTPVMKRGKGPYLYDYDGNRYVDFFLDGGTLLLGHAHPQVTSTLKSWLNRGYDAGAPMVSHELLSRRLCRVIGAVEEQVGSGEWVFLYTSSALETTVNLFTMLRRVGYGTISYASSASEYRVQSSLSRLFTVKDPARSGADLIILRPPLDGEKRSAEWLMEMTKRGDCLLISDETELPSHVSLRGNPELLSRLDARIIGKWSAAGLPFGCALVKTSLLEHLRSSTGKGSSQGNLDRHATFTDMVSLSGSIPISLVKAAVRSMDLMEKSGGVAALLEKQRTFFTALNERFFELRGGFVFMKKNDALLHRYGDLRLELLRGGVFLPLSSLEPISLSHSHSEELLKKSARQMGLLFDTFNR